MRNRTILKLIVMLPLLAGCSVASYHNLTPALLEIEPSIHTYCDPSSTMRLAGYATFSVVPMSVLIDESSFHGLLEKQMLFQVRNFFERRGYRFVEIDDRPDFYVTVDGKTPYQETYVPSTSVTIPQWVPGTSITQHKDSFGTFDFSTFGGINTYGWRDFSGHSTSTTYVPGYLTARTYTRPGYTSGSYFPSILIFALDGKTHEIVWSGSGVGASRNGDIRVSGQTLLSDMIDQFPACDGSRATSSDEDGCIGVEYVVLTNDGNAYFPTVVAIRRGSPAWSAGVRAYDMILSVDGNTAQNLPTSRIAELLKGPAGTPATLGFWRMGKQFTRKITREQCK